MYLPTYLPSYLPTYLPFCIIILPFMYYISSHLFLSIISQHTLPLFAVVIECVLVFHHYPSNMVATLTAIGTTSVYMMWYLILIGWMDEWMDGQMDGWTDGWIDGWMHGRTDR